MHFDPKMCGKRIQVLRKKKGLTQLQLSFKINVSESHLRAIETGIRGASIAKAKPPFSQGFGGFLMVVHRLARK